MDMLDFNHLPSFYYNILEEQGVCAGGQTSQLLPV